MGVMDGGSKTMNGKSILCHVLTFLKNPDRCFGEEGTLTP